MKRSLFAGLGIAAALILWSSGSAFSAPLSANQAEKDIKACAKAQITLLKATKLPEGRSAKALNHRIRAAVKMVNGLVKTAEGTIDSTVEPLEDLDDAGAAKALATVDFSSLKDATCKAISNVKVNLSNLPTVKQAKATKKAKAVKKTKRHENEVEEAGEHSGKHRGEAAEVER